MTYTNGTMTLPKNASVMDREEMRYVEGGGASVRTLANNIKGIMNRWLPAFLSAQLGLQGLVKNIIVHNFKWAYCAVANVIGRIGATIGGVIGLVVAAAGAVVGVYYLASHRVFY